MKKAASLLGGLLSGFVTVVLVVILLKFILG